MEIVPMPELPEVETVKRGLEIAIQGKKLVNVQTRRLDLRKPIPQDLNERLKGLRATELSRRGKYLLINWEGKETLIIHLGMSGRAVIGAGNPNPAKHDHVIFNFEDGVSVTYTDPRRFGLIILGDHEALESMGPEPLADDFTGEILKGRLKNRKNPIKQALLDQENVAGVGNIYACEALFRAEISPLRPANSLALKEANLLVAAIKAVLFEAIKKGGSSLKDHVRPDGEIGLFQHNFKVYDKEGESCPGCDCEDKVKRIVQGGRATFYCAKRQK